MEEYIYKGSGDVAVIPEGIKAICHDTFKENNKFSTLVLPKSIRQIDGFALYQCNLLKTIIYDGVFIGGLGLLRINSDFKYLMTPKMLIETMPKNVQKENIRGFCNLLFEGSQINDIVKKENLNYLQANKKTFIKNIDCDEMLYVSLKEKLISIADARKFLDKENTIEIKMLLLDYIGEKKDVLSELEEL